MTATCCRLASVKRKTSRHKSRPSDHGSEESHPETGYHSVSGFRTRMMIMTSIQGCRRDGLHHTHMGLTTWDLRGQLAVKTAVQDISTEVREWIWYGKMSLNERGKQSKMNSYGFSMNSSCYARRENLTRRKADGETVRITGVHTRLLGLPQGLIQVNVAV